MAFLTPEITDKETQTFSDLDLMRYRFKNDDEVAKMREQIDQILKGVDNLQNKKALYQEKKEQRKEKSKNLANEATHFFWCKEFLEYVTKAPMVEQAILRRCQAN